MKDEDLSSENLEILINKLYEYIVFAYSPKTVSTLDRHRKTEDY